MEPKTREVSIRLRDRTLPFRLFDTPLCHEITLPILRGTTYPRVPFLSDPRVIIDVGANIGAAAVYFASVYPHARVISFEPAPAAFALLQKNVSGFANVTPHNFGLLDHDCEMPLHLGKDDAVTNSLLPNALTKGETVTVTLRHAAETLHRLGIDAIDILKIDTEGCELPILRNLTKILPRTKSIYLEYHDETDRIAIDLLLRDTHILVESKLRHPHRGELCYVSYSAFPSRERLEALRIRSAPQSEADAISPTILAATTTSSLRSAQEPFAAAVVMPTIIRPSLERAVKSVFAQRVGGHCQLLIGIDKAIGNRDLLDDLLVNKPENWCVTVLDLGYSTSRRHGGLHAPSDGGALRTILSYSANSRYLAYLDDDNWWAPDHLALLLEAVEGHDYAYGYRWFVDPNTHAPLAVDIWESVGPKAGVFKNRFGGFIDPNTLMIDKARCEPVLQQWMVPLAGDAKRMSADRHVFHALSTQYSGKCTEQASCYYVLDQNDALHDRRMELIREAGTRRSSA